MAASVTFMHDPLLPHPPGGLAPGAALALLAHAGLLLALTQATDWRVQPPEVISAELWAAVPQSAAPRPAEPAAAPVAEPAAALIPAPPSPSPPHSPSPSPPIPTPAPAPVPAKVAPPPRPDADIATERAEQRKAEREQQRRALDAAKEREFKSQAQAQAQTQTQRAAEATRQQANETERTVKAEKLRREQARELLADEARLAEQREQNLRRMMGQAGPPATGNAGGRGSAAQDAAPSAAYSGRLAALIRANTVFTGSVPDTAVAEVEVRAAASGAVLARRLVKSSGHTDWDEAVLRAIDRTGRLPRDSDGRVPPVMIIAFKPKD